MKFRRRRREDAGVDITPLIDCVFLLLIFFSVSTTFVRQTELNIDLPEANGEARQVEKDIIEITIDQKGDYAVNDRLLANNDTDTLIRALREQIAEHAPTTHIIITADARASHGDVVRAMDAAGRVGLSHISITTRQPEDDE